VQLAITIDFAAVLPCFPDQFGLMESSVIWETASRLKSSLKFTLLIIISLPQN